jgi:CCR4-NOT transcription complex subunit 7/8
MFSSLIIYYSGDIYAEDSIELLKTSGIDFEKFERNGIDVQYFGEIMMMSGLVLTEQIRWISFHSSYDFGYLLKVLTCSELPMDESSFLDLLHIFFPCIYDVKVHILFLFFHL